MDLTQQAAYIIAMSASAMIECMAMIAHNQTLLTSHPSSYGYNEFMELIPKYGIHHNQVIESFR